MSECERCGECCKHCGDLAYGEGSDQGVCPALKYDGEIAICECQDMKPDVCEAYPFPDMDGGKCMRQLKK